MVGRVGLYTAGGAHLGYLVAFGGCAALPVLLGVWGYFQLSSVNLIWGLTWWFLPALWEMQHPFFDSPITTSPREILAVWRSGESASDSFA
jgi:hypothetical protein